MLQRAHKPQKSIHIDPRARLKYAIPMGESAPKAVGYIRVSTDEQATEGISLDVQRDRIINYCQQFGLNLIDIYRDEWTGKELTRPGIQTALARVVETGAMLVAVSLCRISRSVGDWHSLLDSYFGRNARYKFLAFDIAGVDAKTAAGETLIYFRAVMRKERCRRPVSGLPMPCAPLKLRGWRVALYLTGRNIPTSWIPKAVV